MGQDDVWPAPEGAEHPTEVCPVFSFFLKGKKQNEKHSFFFHAIVILPFQARVSLCFYSIFGFLDFLFFLGEWGSGESGGK